MAIVNMLLIMTFVCLQILIYIEYNILSGQKIIIHVTYLKVLIRLLIKYNSVLSIGHLQSCSSTVIY